MRGSDRECLALREQALTKEGDAFLGRMRMPDVVLLMEDGPPGTCALGMHRPYGRTAPVERTTCRRPRAECVPFLALLWYVPRRRLYPRKQMLLRGRQV
jgi:hypothetical protein